MRNSLSGTRCSEAARRVMKRWTLAADTVTPPPLPTKTLRRSRFRLGPDNRYVLSPDGRPIPRAS